MVRKKWNVNVLFAFLCMILVFSGCVKEITISEGQEDVTPSATTIDSTPILPTTTVEKIITQEYATHTIEITQAPTLSPDQKYNQVTQLLSAQGCEIPCWWGFTPGITSYEDVESSLNELAIDETQIFGTTESGLSKYRVQVSVPESISDRGKISLQIIHDPYTLLLKSLNISGNTVRVSDLMEMFGVPEEVFFAAPLGYPGTRVETILYLHYPSKGLIVEIFTLVPNTNPGESLEFCDLNNPLDPEFYSVAYVIANPDSNLPFEEALTLGRNIPMPYSPIEEVSNFESTKFYENFKEQLHNCLVIDLDSFGKYVNP